MNSTIYIFGSEVLNSSKSYSQYPLDYAEGIFKKYETYLEKDSLLVVHRTDVTVYHIYYKRVQNGYIGMCVLLNSLWIYDINRLKEVFEKVFSEILERGVFLSINRQGNVLSQTLKISESNKVHIEDISDKIRYYIEKLENYTSQLPPQNVSVSKEFVHKLSNNASNTSWKNAFNTYRNIVSSYGSSENSTNLLLKKLSEFAKERDEYKQKSIEWQKECGRIERQKKQIKNVVILIFVLIGCGIGILSLTNNLSTTQRQLDIANDEIKFKEEKLFVANETIEEKDEKIKKQNNKIKGQRDRINQLKDSVEDYLRLYNNEKDNSTSMSLDDKDCQTIIVNKNISTDYHVWTLKQVDFTSSETVCRWEVTPKIYVSFIQMTEGVYIIDNKGKKYNMISYDGISMTPQQDTILGIRTIDFTVTFPAVDTDATSITYYSSPSFQIRDIPVAKNEKYSTENSDQ